MAAARGIGLSSREIREVRKVFYFRCLEIWRFGVLEGVPILLRNKGVVGYARRLAGRRKLQGKRCDLHISTLLHG